MERVEIVITDEEKERLERFERRPALSEILNLHDFEVRVIFSSDYPLLLTLTSSWQRP